MCVGGCLQSPGHLDREYHGMVETNLLNGIPLSSNLGLTQALLYIDACRGLGIVSQYNSGLTELQGMGQNISPMEFYWRELINSTGGRERIGKPLHF